MTPTRWLRAGVGVAVLVGAAIVTTDHFTGRDVRRLAEQVHQLEREKTQLREYADRLSACRRVAQAHVLEQHDDGHGGTVTLIRWQQIGEGGVLGVPETIEIRGDVAYFEGRVIKFDHRLVGEGDAGRGASLAMFRRTFGNQQPPDSGHPLDQTAPPRGAEDAVVAAAHQRLWERFAEMGRDPRLAAEFGVRVAQIEAPAVPVRPGDVWEVTLDAAGGLNLRRIASQPPPRTPARRDNLS